jgi:hypothetical protein
MSEKQTNLPAVLKAVNRSITGLAVLAADANRKKDSGTAHRIERSLIRMRRVRDRLLAAIERDREADVLRWMRELYDSTPADYQAAEYRPTDSLDQETAGQPAQPDDVEIMVSTFDVDARQYFEMFDRDLAGVTADLAADRDVAEAISDYEAALRRDPGASILPHAGLSDGRAA